MIKGSGDRGRGDGSKPNWRSERGRGDKPHQDKPQC